MNNKSRLGWLGIVVLLAGGLPFFFLKYVPFVSPFLELLLVLAGLVFMVTLYREEWGVILFVFLFPLVNNLPYFFGINLNIPHAPTACVLFLFFLFAWALRSAITANRGAISLPFRWPLVILSGLIIISGIVTFFRFTAFFPFRADGLYEFKTNVLGVTSGGALMGTLFSGINYLGGFLFLVIVFKLIKKRKRVVPHLFISLALATIISCGFGFIQRFIDLSWGNTPFWVRLSQVNATFKDPNAFAFFLSGVIPLFLGLLLIEKGRRKIFFLVALVAALSIFPFIGNRSSFLGLVVSLFIFVVILVLYGRRWLKERLSWRGRARNFLVLQGIIIFLLVGAVIGGSYLGSKTRLFQRLKAGFSAALRTRSIVALSPERYFLWREALLMIKDYPLSGVGLGAYIIELPNYYVLDKASLGGAFQGWQRNDSAENYFLHGGAELGVIALIFWGWLFWLIGRQVVRGIRRKIEKGERRERDDHGGDFRERVGGLQINFLSLSLSLSLVALGVNYLFHSYVGSFESKFLFWGLTAFLFGLSGVHGNEDGNVNGNVNGKRGGERAIINSSKEPSFFGNGGDDQDKGQDKEIRAKAENKEEIDNHQVDFFQGGRGRKIKKYVGLILVGGSILVFSVSSIWQATHSLSLSSRTKQLPIDQNFGWYGWEEDAEGRRFQWSRSYGGRMIKVENPYLNFEILASHPGIEQNPVVVKIYQVEDFFKQKKLLAEFKLDDANWHQAKIQLSPEVVGKDVIILFKVSRTWVPLREIGAPDPRRLGVAVTPFRFVASKIK